MSYIDIRRRLNEDVDSLAQSVQPFAEEPSEPTLTPDQMRTTAWELFRKAAEMRTEADELARRAAHLLKLAAESDGGTEQSEGKA